MSTLQVNRISPDSQAPKRSKVDWLDHPLSRADSYRLETGSGVWRRRRGQHYFGLRVVGAAIRRFLVQSVK